MSKTFARLASITGTILIVIAAFIALVVLFSTVVRMHAPLIPTLYVTLLMTGPLFLLGWSLRRAGRPPPPQAWYRVNADGKLAGSACCTTADHCRPGEQG